MNNKEILIETLRGSTAELKKSADAFSKLTMTDIAGFDAIYEFVQCVVEVTKAQVAMQNALNDYLDKKIRHGYRKEYLEAQERKKSGADYGILDSPENILKKCSFKDNVLYLPQQQLNKKSYATVKQWVKEAGGKWAGGKVQGFTFDFDATRVASILMKGERCNLAQEFQFFETPVEIADWLVSLVGEIGAGMRILEPSAGRGAIVKAIHRVCPEVTVDCYELMPENREFLQTMQNVRVVGENFEEERATYQYDVIVANPPFSKNQDIRHLRRMYAWLKPYGVVAAITSTHWVLGQEKTCIDFKEWLKRVDAHTYEIGEGQFASSGTKVNTMAIVITKKQSDNER